MSINDYALLGYLVTEIMRKTGSCCVEDETRGGPAVRSGDGHRRDDHRPNGTVLHAVEVLAAQLGIAMPRPVRAMLPTCPEIGSSEDGGL